jgi:coatomer protein complex subunit alpha (xenin)
LFILPKDGGRGEVTGDSRRGSGIGAVFVARNRFATLDKQSNNIIIKNLDNEMTKKCPCPTPGTDMIFYAGTGSLLCRSEDKMVLFDLQQRAAIAELATPPIKYVVWASDMSRVALLSKHAIVLSDRKLGHSVTVHETIRVKSGAWDDHGVFIYTTLNHIKYALPNGDSGIVRTLDNPVYLTKVFGNVIYCLDRDGRNRQIQFDSSEYMFKLALNAKRFDHVLSMIKSGQLCGQSIIAYLQKKGYPEIALHFVQVSLFPQLFFASARERYNDYYNLTDPSLVNAESP